MHDIRMIREDPDTFADALAVRGVHNAHKHVSDIVRIDGMRRENQTEAQKGQSRLKDLAKEIGKAMAAGDQEEADELKGNVADLKYTVAEQEARTRNAGGKIARALEALPNLAADDVPLGKDENDNVAFLYAGETTGEGPHHADFGPRFGMDFEAGAKLSGTRFTVLRGQLAMLQRALGQFMLAQQTTQGGYTEMSVPLMVREEVMHGTGQLPKFKDDCFTTTDDRWLIPTAEVALTNLVREEIIEDLAAPLRYTALTQCFRAEAGAAGRDTRGYIRQHQFEKVELVSICREQEAAAEHEHMLASAQRILDLLKLPYRVVLLCAGDMGFAARKTYDIEVWMPGQNTYREIASISWCGDFQGRRMNTRYRNDEGKTEFVHTLNGSGLAVGRTLVAVMENYLEDENTIVVPDALRPFMGGLEKITAQ